MAKTVEVSISTGSGFFPEEGFVRVPEDEKVHFLLEKAQLTLDLKDTGDWGVNVAGRRIDPEQTYAENGLGGEVTLSWGPKRGGGG
ncbi:MAG: hypothetical protein OXG82_06120 [Gammaproteobacteria bacterium]|nr:hypothetical protein [Gammaproteobacteria bacterium]